MKKYLLCALCSAILIGGTTACSDNEETELSKSGKVQMEFRAGTDEVTRTILTDGNAIQWETNDAISLFDPNLENNEFTTTGNGPSVTFSGMAFDTEGTYYALYPYDGKAMITGSSITTTLPSEQTLREGSFAQGLNPSVAVADNNQNLYFKNTCAVVKFTLQTSSNNTVTKAVLRGNEGESLAGTLVVDAAADDPSAVLQDGGSTAVTLNGSFNSGKTYYFVVAPMTLNGGLTLTLYDSQSNGWTRVGTSQTTLTAGHILDLGTISADNFAGYTKDNQGIYHIYSADGLKAWSTQSDCLTSHVILENNIDMTNETWPSNGSNIQGNYAGEFDGNNKSIENLIVNNTAINIGFFSGLTTGAKVHHVTFNNASIQGSSSSYAGVIAGASLGTIDHCQVITSNVSGLYAGAITGNNSLQVTNCYVSSAVVHADMPGGMAGGIAGVGYGKIEYCTVHDSFITADGSSSRAGGILGSNSQESGISTSGRLLKCAVDDATISGSFAGGIAGENSFGIIAQCVANRVTISHASQNTSTRLGGVVGYNTRGDIVACYSANSTIGADNLTSEAMGGITGYNNNSSAYVYGCYSTHVSFLGNVSGTESGIGAIAGYTSGHVTSCYAILPDGITNIDLVGNTSSLIDHCVNINGTNYETLTTANDLNAEDGSIWIAKNIWDLTASGYPTIQGNYIGAGLVP